MFIGSSSKRIPSVAELAFRTREFTLTLGERLRLAPRATVDMFAGSGISRLIPIVLVESLRNLEPTREIWKRLFPRSVERSIAEADDILRNRIEIFSDRVEFEGAMDWHRDYRSGTRAPLAFCRSIDTLDCAAVGDVKNIWELNRFGYLMALGKAFLATGDKKYFEKWRELLVSWLDANPIDRGVNWNSSLELAIRAVNWIWSSWFFGELLENESSFLERFAPSLLAHGDRINRHLSYYFSPNTHLTGEALGLLYIGLAYPETAKSRDWASTGKSILRSQFPMQVLEDGGYFERATWYHKYTLDFYLHATILCGLEGAGVDSRALKHTIAHLALLSESDGKVPLLGDSDGGELLFLGESKGNLRGICCIGAILLGDGELKDLSGGEYREEALWLLGPSSFEKFESIERKKPRSYHSFNVETGWYCLRTGMSADDSFVIFDCGPHGWARCGHAHSDLLSFLWYCRGTAIAVDPGTPVYGGDPTLRDLMRSSLCHNTITVERTSQSIPGELFGWRSVARPVLPGYSEQGQYGFLQGQHDGYDRFGCRHWRGILFAGRPALIVADIVRCAKPVSSIAGNLQLGEGKLHYEGDGIFRFLPLDSRSPIGVRILGVPLSSDSIEEGSVSKDYNRLSLAPRIRWQISSGRGDILVFTVFCADFDDVASFALGSDFSLGGSAGGKKLTLKIEAAQSDSKELLLRPSVFASIEDESERIVFSHGAPSGSEWRREASTWRKG